MEERKYLTQREMPQQIDLMEYAEVLVRKMWLIVIGALVGAIACGVYTVFAITPLYQSSATIYTIMSRTVDVAELANISLGDQLSGDFLMVAKSRPVLSRVIDDLGLDMSTDALKACVNVTRPENTHMLVVTVVNPDPNLAKNIANDLAEVMCERVAEVMNNDKPVILEEAIRSTRPTSPNFKKNVETGGLIGAVLVASIILLLHMLRETISTEEDVERYLGLNTLGMVPKEKELA